MPSDKAFYEDLDRAVEENRHDRARASSARASEAQRQAKDLAAARDAEHSRRQTALQLKQRHSDFGGALIARLNLPRLLDDVRSRVFHGRGKILREYGYSTGQVEVVVEDDTHDRIEWKSVRHDVQYEVNGYSLWVAKRPFERRRAVYLYASLIGMEGEWVRYAVGWISTDKPRWQAPRPSLDPEGAMALRGEDHLGEDLAAAIELYTTRELIACVRGILRASIERKLVGIDNL